MLLAISNLTDEHHVCGWLHLLSICLQNSMLVLHWQCMQH